MPPLELNSAEKELFEGLQANLARLYSDMFAPSGMQTMQKMARQAHNLHMSLKRRGYEPKHHKYMLKNRGVSTDKIQFYEHIHPVEDLIAFIGNQHANEDPVDTTIGESFEFRVFSNRWDHYDVYTLTRTATGWLINFMSTRNAVADKEGKPALFHVLDHDYISYPNDVPMYMEQIWNEAAEGANKESVQGALNVIAEYISVCEKNAPRGSLFGGIK